MRPRTFYAPRPTGLTLALPCVALAAVCLGACADPLMAEALSPVSAMELQLEPEPAAPEPPPERVLAIVPMGEVRPELVRSIVAGLEREVNATIRIDPARPLPKEAWYAPRKRWRAEKLLAAIDRALPPDAWKTLLVVDVEISTTKDDHFDWGIGGLGNIGGASAVVSTYLIRKHTRGAALLEERLRKLAVHEVGHTLGLPHCEVFACVMSDAEGRLIRSLDASTDHYCGRCRKVLRREWLTRP